MRLHDPLGVRPAQTHFFLREFWRFGSVNAEIASVCVRFWCAKAERVDSESGLGKEGEGSWGALHRPDPDQEYDAAMEQCIAEKVCADTLTRKFVEEDPFTCCGNAVDGYGLRCLESRDSNHRPPAILNR